MLTVKQIEAAKPQEKPYRQADSARLFLFVPPTGKKVWRLRYRFDGKKKTLVIGSFPQISLTEASTRQSEAKMKLLAGVDPAELKQAVKKKGKEISADSLAEIFHEWHANKQKVWSLRYATEIKRMFEDDILPLIGYLKMDEVEPLVMLKVIRFFEDKGAMERADKARQRCREVFRYAIITGRAKYNPAPDLVDALKGYRRENFPFLTMDKIPAFNRALLGYSGSVIAKVATQVLQYTALHTIELRSMAWENIDFENRVITISPDIMKARHIHVVPMSNQVVALLRFMQPITGMHRLVFVGRNDQKKSINQRKHHP